MELTKTPLLTDLYQLTMLQTYYERGMTDQAVFEFFVRDVPGRTYYVAAGLEQALEWLEGLSFTDEERQWVRDCGFFTGEFADRLADFRFSGDVEAVPEGTAFFPGEPMIRVTAPLPEAQLVESRLMNIVHFQTLIATKAARCVIAADGRAIVDFGMRRAHGAEAGLLAARACYAAGFNATATCLANARFGVPVTGTMAHSFILAHDDEVEAFESFARSHPDNVILLIDTYDTEAAARHVVDLAPQLSEKGIAIKAVRLDSGDLAEHARRVRQILDDGGLSETTILASGGLDEFSISELLRSGAPIDGFGVGSKVDTSADAPFMDSAYKLHAYAGKPRYKRSEGKADVPAAKQIHRHYDGNRMAFDRMTRADEDDNGEPLLKPVMRDGRRLSAPESLEDIRRRTAASLGALPDSVKDLRSPRDYTVELSEGLRQLMGDD
ncbi:nicotinate phosphoribosyltransferase [Ectothiorhodospiraceae bacterium WFHF3C12]|nr:nicotinate phosphoribosyltransferase [Ectothiorhodospiraceae bacterium WFHF3C12]